MLQEGLPAVGLIPRKLWMAITTFSIRSSTTYGIPYKFFTDRRTCFHLIKNENLPIYRWDTYTQFAYACKQLGVELGSSSVPQAKGRVERLNQTLQSRLPVELRLAGITTIDAANEFLNSYIKEFNEKFALPLHGIKSVFEVQPKIEKINLILAVLCERTVDTGHCLRHSNKYYRMIDSRGNQVHYRKGTKVIVYSGFWWQSILLCKWQRHLCTGRNTRARNKIKRLRYRLYSAKTKEAPHSANEPPLASSTVWKICQTARTPPEWSRYKNCLRNETNQFNKPQQKAGANTSII